MSNLSPKNVIKIASVKEAPIYVHITYAFFIIAVVAFLMVTLGSQWALKALLILSYLFAAVLFHELGHGFVAHCLGHKVTSVIIYPVGGLANIQLKSPCPKDQALIAFGGPLFNFALFAICFWFEPFAFTSLGVLSLVLGLGNMLPIRSFDGGVILRCLITIKWNDQVAKTVVSYTTLLTVLAVCAMGIWIESILVVLYSIFMLVYGTVMSGNE